ncbi:MAG: hypothetical protein ACI9QC_000592 [Oceanicoccus sp.]|jgi:hypothetical protein
MPEPNSQDQDMTNRNSKTHALVDANSWRPKSGRRNPATSAYARRKRAHAAGEVRQNKIREALAKGNA